MSCDRTGCDKLGNDMVWIEDKYSVWLCKECYDEYCETHCESGDEK